jgi:antitoxin component of MazEF toxin-antitoxin module
MMVAKVQKWGDRLGLRLSKHVLDLAGIGVGDDVEIIVGDLQILVKKLPRPKYDLSELVARIPVGRRPRKSISGRLSAMSSGKCRATAQRLHCQSTAHIS